jgi:outer membrane protein assembly factor BamD (BamD/ComL family)
MKKVASLFFVISLLLFCAASSALAQGNTNRQQAKTTNVIDPAIEADSLHNLEVARHYFKLKKAYRAAIARCDEIIASNPTFSKLDEVLYIAGESSVRLSENRGKQAPNLPPDKLREEARRYFTQLVKDHPTSSFRDEAEKELRALGEVKAEQQGAGNKSQKP